MKLLPIKGTKPLPLGRRPTCNLCGKPLKALIRTEYKRVDTPQGFHQEASHRYFSGRYGFADRFCGINHAAKWAVWAVQQVRVPKPKKQRTAQ